MDRMRDAAMLSVGRAVGFGGLGISMVMLGSAFDVALALRAGFTLTLVLTAILLWNYQAAPGRRAEQFEAWIILPVEDRPSGDAARGVFANIMAETYLYFAVRSFGAAMLMMMLWAFLRMSGAELGIG